MKRIEALKKIAFEERRFDGFLVINATNLLYFTGFQGAACLLIPKNGENILYVYSVNYEQAKAECKAFTVQSMKPGENLMEKIAAQTKTFKIKKLAADTLSIENYRSLRKKLRKETLLKTQNKLIWELRKVKDEKELELMRKAADLTSNGMKAAYEVIKPGIKEYEVAAEIEHVMRKNGSWGTAFETIVASGTRSAFPHGGCTDREIQEGDLVVVDIGATYQYYRSDMTRTLIAGKPTEKQHKIYAIVKEAHERAFQNTKPKAKARDVDAAARKVIESAGYGDCFVHGTGHGVGLEIHEPPTLNQESRDKLTAGNAITIEPGIYIVGFGGIRIEDTVFVHRDSAEKLTKGPYVLKTGE